MIEKIEENLPSIRALLEGSGAILGYLFGSAARGNERADSDIDLAVLLREGLPREECDAIQLRLITEIVGLTHTNDVDVVILNSAPPLLSYQVIATGRVLFGSRRDQVRFETRTIQRYIDTRPLRDRLAEGLLKRIREGARDAREGSGRW